MSHIRIALTVALPLLVSIPAAVAEEAGWLSDGSWYGRASFGIVPTISSDGQFVGPTQSVYGGSPVIEMDDGFQYTVAFGRDFLEEFRLEFELSYLASQSYSGAVSGTELRVDDIFNVDADVDSTIVMANIAYDFDQLNWWSTPYIRGGIGVAYTEVDAVSSVEFNSAIWQGTMFEGESISNQPFASGSTTEFAWSAAAGLQREFADRWALRLEYSFLNRGEALTGVDENGDSITFSDLESQQVLLGVEWRFQ